MTAFFPYDRRGREGALSAPPCAAVPSPRALLEALRAGASAELRAQDVPDPDGEIAMGRAASEMHGHAYNHALAAEEALRICRFVRPFSRPLQRARRARPARRHRALHRVHTEACNPHRRLSAQSSSALATLHRTIPAEQRDDEWRAVDAVLRARERRGVS
jgi:hypothetical protein